MRLISSLLLCMAFLFPELAAQTCTNNLMPTNSDFELGNLSGWQINSGEVTITTDSYSGDYAVKACGPEVQVAYATPYQYGSQYTCVVNVCGKVEGNPDEAGFGLAYFNAFFQLLQLDSISITSTEYECYSVALNPPAGTFAYAVAFAVEGEGCLYLDDFCKQVYQNCNPGEACDDGDPNTSNDVINEECICAGSACGVIANAGSDAAILAGQNIVLTASGGTHYTWSTMQTTASISVMPATTTTYYVTVSDGMGCEEVDDVLVSVIETQTVGNYVWEDINGDGCQDPGEPGLNNVSLEIFNDIGISISSAVSSNVGGQDGYFEFTTLPGNYQIKATLLDDYCFSPTDNCTENLDNNVNVNGFTNMFTVANSTIDNMDIGLVRKPPLPIVLANFDIKNIENSNYLNWVVNTEVGVSKYLLQRKHESELDFETIATLPVNQTLNYDFVDDHLVRSGVYFYRLQIVDQDGAQSYSHVISANFEKWVQFDLLPNVTSDYFSLVLNTLDINSSAAMLSIYDAQGTIVLKQKIYLRKGQLNERVEVGHLSSGLYHVIVESNSIKKSKKLLKI